MQTRYTHNRVLLSHADSVFSAGECIHFRINGSFHLSAELWQGTELHTHTVAAYSILCMTDAACTRHVYISRTKENASYAQISMVGTKYTVQLYN